MNVWVKISLSSLLFNIIYNNKHHEQKINLPCLCCLMLVYMGFSFHCTRHGNGLYRSLFIYYRKDVSGIYSISPIFFLFLNLEKSKRENFLIILFYFIYLFLVFFSVEEMHCSSTLCFIQMLLILQSLQYFMFLLFLLYLIFYSLKRFIGLYGHQFLFVLLEVFYSPK